MIEPLALDLSPAHQDKLFRQSGISVEVAVSRGYRTVTREADGENYRENGWGSLVRFMPALEIPIWTPNGRSAVPQLRPDNPRMRDGKPVKYEFPPGESLHLDVHPSLVERVKGLEPLYITEGVLKADSATSRGGCCVALMGVYGFRGRNLYGGLTALAEWQEINLAERDVYIVFDSDVIQKIQVRQALLALSNFLIGKRARVHVTRLQPGEGGAKVGLDDYLVSGGDLAGLAALSDNAERRPDLIIEDKVVFQTHGGVICEMETNNDGSHTATALCNFDARIKKAILFDDGTVVDRELFITGETPSGSLPQVVVPAKEYDSMSWVTDRWAGRAFIAPGTSKDKLRAAIMDLSLKEGMIDEEIRYAHVGWRKIAASYYYLTASGGLGADGLDTSIVVEPLPSLRGYRLEDQTRNRALADDVRASLSLLDLGPRDTFAALLGGTYLAPLTEWISTNFTVFIEGQTGTLKTESAALMQGHFGRDFSSSKLVGSWSSTANYLEHQASQAKDTVFVVDDFKPAGSRHDIQQLHKTAERFIRNIGNTAGRGRLNADATAKPTYCARGIVICTGEDLPMGESLRARIASVSLKPGDIDLAALTRAQENRDQGTYANAMAGYIQWLARQTDQLPVELMRCRDALRKRFSDTDAHLRSKLTFAVLLVGLQQALRYAVDIEAYTQAEANEAFEGSVEAMLGHLPDQTAQSREQDPVNRFLESVNSGFMSGACHLMSTDSGIFTDGLEAFGWRTRDNGDHYPCGPCIGFVSLNKRRVYLNPNAAFGFAETHGGMDVTLRRLFQTMDERGLLAPRPKDQHRSTLQLRTAIGRVRVVPLRVGTIHVESRDDDKQLANNLAEEQDF